MILEWTGSNRRLHHFRLRSNPNLNLFPLMLMLMYVCVLCSWHQTHLSTFGRETSSSTRKRWQMLHHQGTRPCCPLPGTWTVSPMARTGSGFTRLTHKISMVCVSMIFIAPPLLTGPSLFIRLCLGYLHKLVGHSPLSYDSFIVLWIWLRFYELCCWTLDTGHWKCQGVVCLSCANMCKPVEWTQTKNVLLLNQII